MTDEIRTERTALDVLQGLLPLYLAGKRYVLPVLTTGQNRAWQATLDAPLDPLIDSGASLTDVMTALDGIDLLALIYSYDVTGVLPDRKSIEDDIYPQELLKGVFEIRLATTPTLAYSMATTVDELLSNLQMPPPAKPPSSAPTKRSRPPTAGPTARSATN